MYWETVAILSEWLMIPFGDPLDDQNKAINAAHQVTRVTVAIIKFNLNGDIYVYVYVCVF